MDGYSNSRGTLLSRGRATPLSLVVMSAFALAACGGGGGGGDDDNNNPPANQAPTANAGADKTGNFPEAVSLQGQASDPENATLTYSWSAVATGGGTGTATFTTPTALATNVTFSAPGTYTATLSVSDGTNTATDTVSISVPASYPATSWTQATPADVGLNAAKLDQARDYSLQPNPESVSGGSGMVIRYGKLAYSWGDSTRYEVKSATKSIGGLALLLALAENKVTLQTTAQSQLGADFAASPAENQSNHSDWVSIIDVQNLATHTAGFEKEDEPTQGGPSDGELVVAPDGEWRYSDAGLNWLADVLTHAYVSDLHTVVKSKIFDPLGITSVGGAGAGAIRWRDNLSRSATLNVNGTPVARRELASGMFATVDAMARIGYLMLRKGAWNGTQLIPEATVALVHQPPLSSSVQNPDPTNFPNATANYGLLWWTNASGAIAGLPTDAYWAWGLGEALILVVPSLDLVVARAGPQPTNAALTPRSWNYGWNGDYAVLAPFFTPIAEAAATP